MHENYTSHGTNVRPVAVKDAKSGIGSVIRTGSLLEITCKCKVTANSMLTSPKHARKAAISVMKNTGLLGQFKAREREEENRT